jgi:hypothetical protein
LRADAAKGPPLNKRAVSVAALCAVALAAAIGATLLPRSGPTRPTRSPLAPSALDLAPPAVAETRIEGEVVLTGYAHNHKVGAVIYETKDTNGPSTYIIFADGKDRWWDTQHLERKVLVAGRYEERRDLPVFSDGELKQFGRVQAMRAAPGTDIEKAATRTVLVVTTWRLLPD